MKVLLSWLREFVDVPDSAEEIGRRLSLRGLALEGLDRVGDDVLLDFDVTANRPDCMSMVGIAREIATVYAVPLKDLSERLTSAASSASGPATLPITIDEPDLCARYVGAVADVTVAPSPDWMQARLTACGVRPISNIVDITNYVLLELGQPMHAFDCNRLAGPSIVVRCAKAGEALTTLDGKARTLTSDMLVIADAERAQAIAGVMGGAASEVSSASTRIVFEAAWFKPQSVRATSKRLGLRSEASMRFERGADSTVAARAMARAVELLEQIGAGTPAGPFIDVCPRPYETRTLTLAQARVGGLLGMDVPDTDVVRILTALGFGVAPKAGGWHVTVPGWRVDMHRDVDLIEEVGRHHGFEHLPTTFPGVQQAPAPSDTRIARDRTVRLGVLAAGFSEAITFAFIEAVAATPFLDGHLPVALANPLSETFAVMRPSVLPGLIDAVSHNRRHGRRDVQLFEIGTRFSRRGETRALGLAWTGLATADHWSGGRREVDFFDIKGVVEQITTLFGGRGTIAPLDATSSALAPVFVPGRAATLMAGSTRLAVLGQLAASLADARGLPGADAVYIAELDLDALTAAAPGAARLADPLPRFPSVVRDIAIVVDDALSAETVRGTIRAAAPSTLVQIVEFDRYQGKDISDGKVSLALRLTFQSPDRTLTDEDVHAAMGVIVGALAEHLHAVQR